MNAREYTIRKLRLRKLSIWLSVSDHLKAEELAVIEYLLTALVDS